jgi:uncharacterized membrane protein
MWYRVGRDPQKGTVIPLFKPPQSLSPALIRHITRMAFDNQAFSAALIHLAVKGHADIQEIGNSYTVSRKTGSSQPLSAEEERLVQVFFSSQSSVDLKDSNHALIRRAIEAVEKSLHTQAGKLYFALNRGYAVLGLCLTIGAVLIAWMGGPSLSAVLLSIAGIALNLVFFQLLKARTPGGRKLMDAIEGFKMYLSTVETDRLLLLNPPRQTPELFERYLPYALALDVEQRWASQFAQLFKEARDQGQAYQPAWYSGSHWNPSHPTQFTSRMAGSFTSAIASSSTPPGSSSGGGGGGSSGGGGGGGGGGGW